MNFYSTVFFNIHTGLLCQPVDGSVRMACVCSLKTRRCVLLNVSLIATLLTASSYSLQSLRFCRVEVLKFVHPSADAKGFVVLDFQ